MLPDGTESVHSCFIFCPFNEISGRAALSIAFPEETIVTFCSCSVVTKSYLLSPFFGGALDLEGSPTDP